ncbi:Homeobox protein HOY1 [Verticillium dahliae VDG1]|nr:Homeobox protein HOY1 [Verticillium dahliae VDG1]
MSQPAADLPHAACTAEKNHGILVPNDYVSDAPSTINPNIMDKEKGAVYPGSDAPDGGLAAWLVVLGVWCTAFCSFGWINSVGAFQEYYQNDLLRQYSPSTISWIPSLQIFFMTATGPILGKVYDIHGPRQLVLIGIGFAWAMRISAFLILALLIIANLTVRAFHPQTPQKTTKAQLLRPFRELEFVLITLGFTVFTYGIYVPINFLPVQALEAGMDPNLVQYLIPILNAASLFGRIFSGFLGDKIGRLNIFVIVCYLTGLWILALWIPAATDGALVAFAILFGFCSGAYVSLIGPLVAQVSPLSEIGFRTGLVFFASSIGGLTTNPINGAIIDSPHGLLGMKIFAGVFCMIGTTFILAARIHRTGWKLLVVF